jgi:hypothetical protein
MAVIALLTKQDRAAGFLSGRKERSVAESVYKFIELVGTSSESWEKAAAAAVERAAKTLRDLRVGEVVEMDVQVENGKVVGYRTKVKVSFKIEKDVD